MPAANGDLVLAVHHEVARWNPATGAVTTIARLNETRREVRFNDGKCGPAGRICKCHMGGQREQGAFLRTINVPASHATSCAFGGPDLDELYVTSAGEHFTATDRARDPLAGSLFRVRPGVAGVPMPLFAD